MSSPAHATISTVERPVWQLTQAVLVYASRNATAYATVHDVATDANHRQRLSSGVPATREACADLARALGATSSLGGFLPQHLVYLGAKSLIWWRPPAPARVFFDTTKDAAGDQADDKTGASLIGKKSALVNHPGLVFAVSGGHWYVYALRAAERPGPATPVCRAPYFNVWASGEICSGNVRLPESLSPSSLERYERAFFESEFTHPNARGREKLIQGGGGAYAFWKGVLEDGPDKPFPVKRLVDVNLTLQGLAKRLEKGGRNDD